MMGRMARLVSIVVGVLAIALITMAAVGAAAGVSGSIFKSTTSVSIGAQAKLATSLFGPGVNVTVTYSCFPGFGGGPYPGGGAFGSVAVTDLQGNQGFGSWTPTCNDARQTAVVFVQALAGAKGAGGPASFVAGAGAANAFVCGFDCNSTSREIRIS
jgi:hypothetical protein